MNKTYYTWQDVETAANSIIAQMYSDGWKPDYIVGITRGGLPLATIISHRIGVPMVALGVSLRDGDSDCETNCWLSEWAFGYNYPEQTGITGARWDIKLRKKILIVDDINDTGATFNWIKNDWQSTCLPSETDVWNSIWNNTVKFAVMTDNLSSDAKIDYCWDEVNKAENNSWLVFPYEKDSWLKKTN